MARMLCAQERVSVRLRASVVAQVVERRQFAADCLDNVGQ
jgi:hypothetical protein